LASSRSSLRALRFLDDVGLHLGGRHPHLLRPHPHPHATRISEARPIEDDASFERYRDGEADGQSKRDEKYDPNFVVSSRLSGGLGIHRRHFDVRSRRDVHLPSCGVGRRDLTEPGVLELLNLHLHFEYLSGTCMFSSRRAMRDKLTFLPF
jgi:hypothetical protein